MPQLSLYLDKKTYNQLQEATKIEKTSISKWVSRKIKSVLQEEWPENYFKLFGSLTDVSFQVKPPLKFKNDAKRHKL